MQQQSAQNLTVANTEDIVTTSQKPKKGKSEYKYFVSTCTIIMKEWMSFREVKKIHIYMRDKLRESRIFM